MWSLITGKTNNKSDDGPSTRRKDGPRSTRHRSESIVSSTTARKPSRGDDRDRGFNPTSTSYSSTSRSPYPGAASASVASSYATASSNQADEYITPFHLERNASLANQIPKSRSGRDVRDRTEDPERKSERRRERSSSRDRTRDRKDRSRSRDRDDRMTDKKEKRERRGKDRRLSRSETDFEVDKARSRAGDMSIEATGNFNAQVGSSGFTQFPGQYDGGLPGFSPGPPYPATGMSAHVQDQFPGQFPTQSTAPYRPPLAASEGGPGLAAEFYGDMGQSVAHQPGVRPQPPSLIVGAEPHLQAASAVAAPPPEPSSLGGVGAAASFFSGADDFQSLASKPSRPGRQPKPSRISGTNDLSGPSNLAAGATIGYTTGVGAVAGQSHDLVGGSGTSLYQQTTYDTGPSSYQPTQVSQSNIHHSASAPVIPALGAAAAGAAAMYMMGNHNTSLHQRPESPPSVTGTHSEYRPPAAQHPSSQIQVSHDSFSDTSRPSKPGKRPSQSSNIPLYAAGAAGAAAAYHQSHHSTAQNQYSAQLYGSTSMAQKHHHIGPLGRFVEFWTDPDGVAQFEEYTEYIGVCRYCFAPGSSPREAPRKHHYRRRGSNERYGSSIRVDKDSRYWSSEGEGRRRNKKSWLATGIAGYGIAKAGKSLFSQNRDFDDTYSVRSGHVNQSSSSIIGYNDGYALDRKSRTSLGVTRRSSEAHSRHRSRSRERTETGITSDGKIYKKNPHSGPFGRPTMTTYGSRRRSRSRSRDRKSGLAEAALGADIGASVVASTHQTRTRSPNKFFVLPKQSSRERSPGLSSALGSNHSASRRKDHRSRHSPSSSHVSISRPHTNHDSGILAGFFSSPSERRRSSHKNKKKRGFFSFGNASTSSSDADLAFGTPFDQSRSRKQSRAKERDDRKVDAAILGLGAAAAALAASENRRGKRKADLVAVKEHKGIKTKYVSVPERKRKGDSSSSSSSSSKEDLWESASEESDSASVDSGLAYGRSRRKSQESVLSDSSGTGKWGWRWGTKKKRKEPIHHENESRTVDGAAASLTGIAAGATLASGNYSRGAAMSSASSLPPLQHVYPMPTSDPSRFDVTTQSSVVSSKQPLMTSRPAPTPLQQPQPVLPVSSAVYATQSPLGHSYSAPTGPPVFSQSPHPSVNTHAYESSTVPFEMKHSKNPDQSSRSDNAETFVSQDATIDRKSRRRDSSPKSRTTKTENHASSQRRRATLHDDNTAVRFDFTKEQEDKQRRDKYRREEAERREVDEQAEIDRQRPLAIKPSSVAFGTKGELEGKVDREVEQRRRQEIGFKPENKDAWTVPAAAGIVDAAIGDSIADLESYRADERREKRRKERGGDMESKIGSSAERSNEHSNVGASEPEVIERSGKSVKQAAVKARKSPSHEDYATYFMPPELLSKSDDRKQIFDASADNDVASYQIPDIITIEPSEFRGPSYSAESTLRSTSDEADPSRIALSWSVPRLLLIEPTPPPSIAGSVKGDASPVIRAEDEPITRTDETSEKARRPKVAFGESETRKYTSITPMEDHEEPIKSTSTARDIHGGETESVFEATTDAHVAASGSEGVNAGYMPGGFGDDLEFAATLAAGLQDTGFDPSIVIDNPTFRRRDSPPGSEQADFYRKPFAETVTELGLDSPGTEGVPPQRGFIEGELPPTPKEEVMPIVPGSFEDGNGNGTKSSKREKKTKNKISKRNDKDDALSITNSSTTSLSETEGPRETGRYSTEPEAIAPKLNDGFEDLGEYSNVKKSKGKKSKKDNARFDSPNPGSPLRSEVGRDDSIDAFESSGTIYKNVDNNMSETKDLATIVPLPGDGVDKSIPSARTTANEVFESTELERAKIDLETKDTLKNGIDKETRDLQESSSDEIVSVAASDPVPDKSAVPKKTKKKSKHRSSGYDDVASSVSSPPTYNDPRATKGKSKKEKSGFFGLFGKSTDNLSERNGSREASTEATLDDFEEPKKRGKRSKGRRATADLDDEYDRPVESIGDLPRLDDAVSITSGKSKEKEKRRRSREGSTADDSGRVSQELPGEVYMPAHPPQNPEPQPSVVLTSLEDRDLTDIEDGSSFSDYNRVSYKKDQSPSVGGNQPLSFLGVRQTIPPPPDIDDPFTSQTREVTPLADSVAMITSHPRDIDENLPALPESRPSSPTAVGGAEELPLSSPSRPVSPVVEIGGQRRRLSILKLSDASQPIANTSPTAVPFFLRRPPSSASRSSPLTSPAAASKNAGVFTPRQRQGRPLSTEFKSSTEFRPLWLVERHASRQEPGPEEAYPSLPSSHSTSRSSSVHDADEQDPRRSYGDDIDDPTMPSAAERHALATEPNQDMRTDLLDSQQPTPTAASFFGAADRADSEAKASSNGHSSEIRFEAPKEGPHELSGRQTSHSPQRVANSVDDLFGNHRTLSPSRYNSEPTEELPALPPSRASSPYSELDTYDESPMLGGVAIGAAIAGTTATVLGLVRRQRSQQEQNITEVDTDQAPISGREIDHPEQGDNVFNTDEPLNVFDPSGTTKGRKKDRQFRKASKRRLEPDGSHALTETSLPAAVGEDQAVLNAAEQSEATDKDFQETVHSWSTPASSKKGKKDKKSHKKSRDPVSINSLVERRAPSTADKTPDEEHIIVDDVGPDAFVTVASHGPGSTVVTYPSAIGTGTVIRPSPRFEAGAPQMHTNEILEDLPVDIMATIPGETVETEAQSEGIPTDQQVEDDEWRSLNVKSKKAKNKKGGKKVNHFDENDTNISDSKQSVLKGERPRTLSPLVEVKPEKASDIMGPPNVNQEFATIMDGAKSTRNNADDTQQPFAELSPPAEEIPLPVDDDLDLIDYVKKPSADLLPPAEEIQLPVDDDLDLLDNIEQPSTNLSPSPEAIPLPVGKDLHLLGDGAQLSGALMLPAEEIRLPVDDDLALLREDPNHPVIQAHSKDMPKLEAQKNNHDITAQEPSLDLLASPTLLASLDLLVPPAQDEFPVDSQVHADEVLQERSTVMTQDEQLPTHEGKPTRNLPLSYEPNTVEYTQETGFSSAIPQATSLIDVPGESLSSLLDEKSVEFVESEEPSEDLLVSPKDTTLPVDDDLDLLEALSGSPTTEPKGQSVVAYLAEDDQELPLPRNLDSIDTLSQPDSAESNPDPCSLSITIDRELEESRSPAAAPQAIPAPDRSKQLSEDIGTETKIGIDIASVEKLPKLNESIPNMLIPNQEEEPAEGYFAYTQKKRTKKAKQGKQSEVATPFFDVETGEAETSAAAISSRADEETPFATPFETPFETPIEKPAQFPQQQQVYDGWGAPSKRKVKKGKKQQNLISEDQQSINVVTPSADMSVIQNFGDSQSKFVDVTEVEKLAQEQEKRPRLEDNSTAANKPVAAINTAREAQDSPYNDDKSLFVNGGPDELRGVERQKLSSDSKETLEQPPVEDWAINSKRKGKKDKKSRIRESEPSSSALEDTKQSTPESERLVSVTETALEVRNMLAEGSPSTVEERPTKGIDIGEDEWGLLAKKKGKKGKKSRLQALGPSLSTFEDTKQGAPEPTGSSATTDIALEVGDILAQEPTDEISDVHTRDINVVPSNLATQPDQAKEAEEDKWGIPAKKKGKKSKKGKQFSLADLEVSKPSGTATPEAEFDRLDHSMAVIELPGDSSFKKSRKDNRSKRMTLSRSVSDYQDSAEMVEPNGPSNDRPATDEPLELPLTEYLGQPSDHETALMAPKTPEFDPSNDGAAPRIPTTMIDTVSVPEVESSAHERLATVSREGDEVQDGASTLPRQYHTEVDDEVILDEAINAMLPSDDDEYKYPSSTDETLDQSSPYQTLSQDKVVLDGAIHSALFHDDDDKYNQYLNPNPPIKTIDKSLPYQAPPEDERIFNEAIHSALPQDDAVDYNENSGSMLKTFDQSSYQEPYKEKTVLDEAIHSVLPQDDVDEYEEYPSSTLKALDQTSSYPSQLDDVILDEAIHSALPQDNSNEYEEYPSSTLKTFDQISSYPSQPDNDIILKEAIHSVLPQDDVDEYNENNDSMLEAVDHSTSYLAPSQDKVILDEAISSALPQDDVDEYSEYPSDFMFEVTEQSPGDRALTGDKAVLDEAINSALPQDDGDDSNENPSSSTLAVDRVSTDDEDIYNKSFDQMSFPVFQDQTRPVEHVDQSERYQAPTVYDTHQDGKDAGRAIEPSTSRFPDSTFLAPTEGRELPESETLPVETIAEFYPLPEDPEPDTPTGLGFTLPKSRNDKKKAKKSRSSAWDEGYTTINETPREPAEASSLEPLAAYADTEGLTEGAAELKTDDAPSGKKNKKDKKKAEKSLAFVWDEESDVVRNEEPLQELSQESYIVNRSPETRSQAGSGVHIDDITTSEETRQDKKDVKTAQTSAEEEKPEATELFEPLADEDVKPNTEIFQTQGEEGIGDIKVTEAPRVEPDGFSAFSLKKSKKDKKKARKPQAFAWDQELEAAEPSEASVQGPIVPVEQPTQITGHRFDDIQVKDPARAEPDDADAFSLKKSKKGKKVKRSQALAWDQIPEGAEASDEPIVPVEQPDWIPGDSFDDTKAQDTARTASARAEADDGNTFSLKKSKKEKKKGKKAQAGAWDEEPSEETQSPAELLLISGDVPVIPAATEMAPEPWERLLVHEPPQAPAFTSSSSPSVDPAPSEHHENLPESVNDPQPGELTLGEPLHIGQAPLFVQDEKRSEVIGQRPSVDDESQEQMAGLLAEAPVSLPEETSPSIIQSRQEQPRELYNEHATNITTSNELGEVFSTDSGNLEESGGQALPDEPTTAMTEQAFDTREDPVQPLVQDDQPKYSSSTVEDEGSSTLMPWATLVEHEQQVSDPKMDLEIVHKPVSQIPSSEQEAAPEESDFMGFVRKQKKGKKNKNRTYQETELAADRESQLPIPSENRSLEVVSQQVEPLISEPWRKPEELGVTKLVATDEFPQSEEPTPVLSEGTLLPPDEDLSAFAIKTKKKGKKNRKKEQTFIWEDEAATQAMPGNAGEIAESSDAHTPIPVPRSPVLSSHVEGHDPRDVDYQVQEGPRSLADQSYLPLEALSVPGEEFLELPTQYKDKDQGNVFERVEAGSIATPFLGPPANLNDAQLLASKEYEDASAVVPTAEHGLEAESLHETLPEPQGTVMATGSMVGEPDDGFLGFATIKNNKKGKKKQKDASVAGESSQALSLPSTPMLDAVDVSSAPPDHQGTTVLLQTEKTLTLPQRGEDFGTSGQQSSGGDAMPGEEQPEGVWGMPRAKKGKKGKKSRQQTLDLESDAQISHMPSDINTPQAADNDYHKTAPREVFLSGLGVETTDEQSNFPKAVVQPQGKAVEEGSLSVAIVPESTDTRFRSPGKPVTAASAVSAGISLFETLQQRDSKTGDKISKKKRRGSRWAEREDTPTEESVPLAAEVAKEGDMPNMQSSENHVRGAGQQGLHDMHSHAPIDTEVEKSFQEAEPPFAQSLYHGHSINRDSAVHFSDSPTIPQSTPYYQNVRDSGYHGTEASPTFALDPELVVSDREKPMRPSFGETFTSGTDHDNLMISRDDDDVFTGTNRSSTAEISENPLNISIEVDPDYDVAISRPLSKRGRPRSSPGTEGGNVERSIRSKEFDHHLKELESPVRSLAGLRQPSPVDSTSKDRSSVLFQSSPSTREDRATHVSEHQETPSGKQTHAQVSTFTHDDAGASAMDEVLGTPSAAPHQGLPTLTQVSSSLAGLSSVPEVHHGRGRSLFGGPVGLNSDMQSPPGTPTSLENPNRRKLNTISEYSPEESPLHKKSRDVLDVRSPERGIKAARRSVTPQTIPQNRVRSPLAEGAGGKSLISTDDLISRLSWPAVDEENHSVDLERSRSRNTDMDRRPSSRHSNISALMGDAAKLRDIERRSVSGASIRSGESINAIIRTPDQFRSVSGLSHRSSGTPPLRRVDRSVSGDLRAASKRGEARNPANPTEANAETEIGIPSSSTYDPIKDKGKTRAGQMADVYVSHQHASSSLPRISQDMLTG